MKALSNTFSLAGPFNRAYFALKQRFPFLRKNLGRTQALTQALSIPLALWLTLMGQASFARNAFERLPSVQPSSIFSELGFFQASDNFNSKGTLDALPGDHSFSHTYLKFGGRYQWLDLGLYGNFGYASTDSKQIDGGRIWERSNANLSHLSFGADYLWIDGKLKVLPDFEFELPLSGNNYSGTVPPVYEGAMSLTPRLVTLAPRLLFGLDWAGYFGLKYRIGDLGSPLVWGTSLGLDLGQIYLRSALEGFETVLSESGGTRQQERSLWHCRTSGCAKHFDAHNPSFMEVKLDSEFRFLESWAIGLGLDYPLMGKNISSGISFRAGIAYGWGGPKTTRPTPAPPRPAPQFVPEQKQDVDHKLFRTPPPEPIQGERIERRPPPPPQMRRTAPRPPPIDINRELRETEMKIELKRAPRKNQPSNQRGR